MLQRAGGWCEPVRRLAEWTLELQAEQTGERPGGPYLTGSVGQSSMSYYAERLFSVTEQEGLPKIYV